MNTQTSFVYITEDDKVLLLQEGGRLAYGLWSIPGGHVDPGESFEQAAVREAIEESGYEVKLESELYSATIKNTEYKGSKGDSEEVDIKIFKASTTGGELKLDDQALDLKWMPKEEALKLDLRWAFLKDIIKNN